MSSIEFLCNKISTTICDELNFDNDKKAIINYGIFAVIQIGISIISVFIFGLIFNVQVEALIITFTISILRKSSGGVHATSPGKCAIIGTIVGVGFGIIAKELNVNEMFSSILGVLVFMWAYFVIKKLAPVDSIAKPIKNLNKRNRLNKKSLNILKVYFIIVVANITLYYFLKDNRLLVYSICIYMGIAWQVFSLTKSCHYIFKFMEKF